MGLLDDFHAEEFATNYGGGLCAVQLAMQQHPDEADDIFQITTHEPHGMSYPALERWFSRRGVKIPESTLKRHYQGLCKCDERMPERYESA